MLDMLDLIQFLQSYGADIIIFILFFKHKNWGLEI